MTTTCKKIKLRDRRLLAYTEFGNPQGKPVLYFHGAPGSRLGAKETDSAARKLNARVVGIDRPGIGCSNFQPGRQFLDWPNDVIQLADALKLDRFAVMGVSGSAPYVAGCALKIPNRLTSASIVCGMGPVDVPGITKGMPWLYRLGFPFMTRLPWFAKTIHSLVARLLRYDTERTMRVMMSSFPAPDIAALNHPEFGSILVDAVREALHFGTAGLEWEWMMYTRPWGIRLDQIPIEIQLWHGELDVCVPPAMARHMERTIPRCQATYFSNEGHLSLRVNHMDKILGALIASGPVARKN
ncbi:MAG: alpha/beta fold hydrolase [Planctomycetota bacterium]|jgi:pimeloyl-ACP methyl ester carboxylesterase